MSDIIDTLRTSGSFNAFNTALQRAGLVEKLQEPGPFTVFAPNDDAFLALPESATSDLFRDPDRLIDTLLYHIVEGEYLAEDIIDMQEEDIESVQGQDLLLGTSAGITVNQAVVLQSDILCDNGIIHVIDAVLAPRIAATRV